MFYHPEILQRRSGCFGTIWLAATCVSRLQRREIMAVNVTRTCHALSAFIQGLSPPLMVSSPPLRCSLYLAALLQLGLTRVYWRQCRMLAEEVASVWGRLHRLHPPPSIDLSPTDKLQLLPSALQAAPDPFFGVMAVGLPSPAQLMQVLEEPLFLAPTPESITMREAERLTVTPLMEEAELPEPTPEELQFLSEAESELLPHLEEIPEEEEEELGVLEPVMEAPEEPQLPPEAAPSPPPRRRPPSRPHMDPQVQIPADEIRAQLHPTAHCSPMMVPELPPEWLQTPAELFRTPAVGWLPPPLWDLWVRAARPKEPKPEPEPEPSEMEVPREVLEPSVGLLPSSELTLEVTPEEPRPTVTPAEEWRAPPPLLELPEEAELPPVGVASLERAILEGAGRPEGAELNEILPSSAHRKLWARLFRVCLDLCASGWLRLEQSRPFGPIRIQLGSRGPAHFSPSPAHA